MAKAVINLQKESGGIVKISPVDGVGVTELVVPESGNLVSVDTAVTDNAIARYDGTTGKLKDSGVIIDVSGNLLLTSGTGALGYGAGAGGTVTQLTSKSTAVTLNKPTGRIIINDSSLAAGATVGFALNNSLIGIDDKIEVEAVFGAVYYNAYVYFSTTGVAYIAVENKGGTERTDALAIKFVIIKGATA